jgi:hypothetical protein
MNHRKQFFFEKRNQKTFDFRVRTAATARDSMQKFWGFFFSKKSKSFLFLPPA